MSLSKMIGKIREHKITFRFAAVTLLFLFTILSGCEIDSDMNWKSFTSTGRIISSSSNYWTYEHSFLNSSSDRVLLKYNNGSKDEHGFSNENQEVILQYDNFIVRITYYDFMSRTPHLSCSVGTYDGRGLNIESGNGRTIFRDKE